MSVYITYSPGFSYWQYTYNPSPVRTLVGMQKEGEKPEWNSIFSLNMADPYSQ